MAMSFIAESDHASGGEYPAGIAIEPGNADGKRMCRQREDRRQPGRRQRHMPRLPAKEAQCCALFLAQCQRGAHLQLRNHAIEPMHKRSASRLPEPDTGKLVLRTTSEYRERAPQRIV